MSKSNIEEIVGLLWLIAANVATNSLIAIGCSVMSVISMVAAVHYAIKAERNASDPA
jgi:hypothetical protein